MPLLRGASSCLQRAPPDGLCGGSSLARRCLPLRRACFRRSADERNVSALISSYHQVKNTRQRWRPVSALETGAGSSASSDDGQDSEENAGFLSRTRLGRLVQAAARALLAKLNSGRTNSPTKVFLVLLGFYTANALATILGQTGDWDVLVAGVVVAAIEGVGMLKYRKPAAAVADDDMPRGRFQSLVAMVNFWKSGVCLGFFVDAFKVGS